MPILYNNISGGRFLCALFFICISLAGFSTMVGFMERPIRVAVDFGIRRVAATIIIGLVTFFIGLASALNLDILINQDKVWGYALLISGLICSFMIYRVGGERYRKEIVNKFGIGDWKLPRIWTFVICVVVPLQAVGILIWYITNEIADNEEGEWYKFSATSLITVLIEWAVTMLILVGLNWWLKPLKYDPKDPNSWFNRVLKLLIRSSAIDEQQSLLIPPLSDDCTSDNDNEEMVEYHHPLTSDPSDSNRENVPSDEETKI